MVSLHYYLEYLFGSLSAAAIAVATAAAQKQCIVLPFSRYKITKKIRTDKIFFFVSRYVNKRNEYEHCIDKK